MKRTIATLTIAAAAFGLAACSSEDDTTAASATTADVGADGLTSQERQDAAVAKLKEQQAKESATATAAASKPNVQTVGDRVANGSAAITVRSVEAVNNISFAKQSYRDVFETKTARAGGQFVVVHTTVENIGTKSMDLTCGYPIANALVDVQTRSFDTIDDLYRVEGNPECNDNLQPGFTAEMAYVYEIPIAAIPKAFGFYTPDTQSMSNVKFIETGTVPPPA